MSQRVMRAICPSLKELMRISNPLMQRPPGVLHDGAIPWPPAALVSAGNDCTNPLPGRWQPFMS